MTPLAMLSAICCVAAGVCLGMLIESFRTERQRTRADDAEVRAELCAAYSTELEGRLLAQDDERDRIRAAFRTKYSDDFPTGTPRTLEQRLES